MIYANSHLCYFADLPCYGDQPAPLLRCPQMWLEYTGKNVTIGLLDSDVDCSLPDLQTADINMQHFSKIASNGSNVTEHGTCSAALLVGQGRTHIRGIVPCARLLAADVLGMNWQAQPQQVVEALKWFVEEGVNLVVIPMCDYRVHSQISCLIEKDVAMGVIYVASAGNWYPLPIGFPACHPLVVAVGAADNAGRILPNCSRHPKLEMLAPGWKVISPVSRGLVRSMSGSSVACVMAAGAIALGLSRFQNPSFNLRDGILGELCRI